jgi:hypothetical protein
LARCDILFTSLSHFAEPGLFREILVVVPSQEERAIRAGLLPFTALPLTVICEDDILSQLRLHGEVFGWTCQQLIKLAAANIFGTEFYLTLDADIVLCRPLAFDDVVPDGKALIEPEARTMHPDWWERSAQVLGLSADLSAPGMSVTPALLSRSICKQLFIDLERRYERDWAAALLAQTGWTEYTLYYLTAERHGALDRFHTLPEAGRNRLLCRSNVWMTTKFDIWSAARCFEKDEPGLFAIIQSNSGISARKVRTRLRPYLRVNRPTWRQMLVRTHWRWWLLLRQSRKISTVANFLKPRKGM